tara:strand:- start:233 stop:400 length:168 start_codon:yes stop_codon:yes gene_type:complete
LLLLVVALAQLNTEVVVEQVDIELRLDFLYLLPLEHIQLLLAQEVLELHHLGLNM